MKCVCMYCSLLIGVWTNQGIYILRKEVTLYLYTVDTYVIVFIGICKCVG